MDDKAIGELTQAVLERIFIPLEASARHVHLTREQCMALFGSDLTPKRPLSQPGQFLSEQRVALIGPKGRIENVAVLGPVRKSAQVEVSLTDSRALGIDAPIRLSGDTKNTPGMLLEGSRGRIAVQEGVIVAKRHLHLTPLDAARFGVKDGQSVRLQAETARPTVFCDTVVRVSEHFSTAAHLDIDEANACGLKAGELGRIVP